MDSSDYQDEENTIVEEENAKTKVYTMEISVFFTSLAMTLTESAVTNIVLYRSCVHSLQHDEDQCQGFLNPKKAIENNVLEGQVQKYAIMVQTVKSVVESACPAVLSLFLGSWSDIYGRKPLLTWPLVGLILTSTLNVIYSILSIGPWWFILTCIPLSLSGGNIIFFIASLCHLSDVTTTEKRSFRMVMMDATMGLGMVIGGLISPYLLRFVGYVVLLSAATVLYALAFCYSKIFVKESLKGATKGNLSSIFDWSLFKKLATVALKPRPNNGRTKVLLIVLTDTLMFFIMYGLSGVEYMFTRQKLNWALSDFTMYNAMKTVITFIGCFIGIGLLQHKCGISDLALIIFGISCSTIGYIIKCFATATWHMYLAITVAMFEHIPFPLLKSFVTKIVPMEDIAKILSLGAAIEGFWPIIAPLTYNSLYAATLTVLPGAVYLLSSAINGVSIIATGIVIYYHRRWKPVS